MFVVDFIRYCCRALSVTTRTLCSRN